MRIANIIKDFITTLRFFTTLPLPDDDSHERGLAHMALWVPWAGLVIGIGLVVAYSVSMRLFPPAVAAALVLSVWILLTGGLHLDGLGDCWDAFPAPVSVERRLEIMRDPHLGTFGVIGIILAILLKYCLIFSLPAGSWINFLQNSIPFPMGLLYAPVAARWLVLWAARGRTSPARGMGKEFAQGITFRHIIIAGILPLILIGINELTALAALVVAGAGVWLFTKIAEKKIVGISGDVLGACIEIGEILILLVYVTRLG